MPKRHLATFGEQRTERRKLLQHQQGPNSAEFGSPRQVEGIKQEKAISGHFQGPSSVEVGSSRHEKSIRVKTTFLLCTNTGLGVLKLAAQNMWHATYKKKRILGAPIVA